MDKKELDQKDLAYFTSVVKTFEESGESIRDTAIRLNLSRTKVRKILITMGVLESEITEQALALLQTGLTQNEVAMRLNLSIATLSTYLPYGNRVYKRDEKSPTAVRVEECRSRQQQAARKQVICSAWDHKERNDHGKKEWRGDRIKVKETGKVISLDAYRQSKQKPSSVKRNPQGREEKKVFQLRMELAGDNGPLDHESMAILQQYGKVTSSLSRTILVPGEMTLYALHYAIQRSFGWQNSHLHHFSYEDSLFREVTGGKFGSWKKYCGQYFRFPYHTGSDMEDIYWNDDYQGRQSIKNWLKEKYTGSYSYEGQLEQFFVAQANARIFAMENQTLDIGPSYAEYREGKRDHKQVPVNEVKIEELRRSFECGLDELLERLTVEEVLGLQIDVEEAKHRVLQVDEGFEEVFEDWYETPDSLKSDYSREHTGKVLPFSDHILYDYDYGDGWRVQITCEEIYTCSRSGEVLDNQSVEMMDEEKECILSVASDLTPIGIAVDGRNVLDDVGGIYGYCEFLKSVYARDYDPEESNGPFTDRESSLEWARGLGWNGRMSKPDKLL